MVTEPADDGAVKVPVYVPFPLSVIEETVPAEAFKTSVPALSLAV